MVASWSTVGWRVMAGCALWLVGCAAQPDYNDVVAQRDEARKTLVAVQGSIEAARDESKRTSQVLAETQATLAVLVKARDQLEAANAKAAELTKSKEASDAKVADLQKRLGDAELDRDRAKRDLTALQKTAVELQAKVVELEAKAAAPATPPPAVLPFSPTPPAATQPVPTSAPGP
jgi:septal ring factor EnvC (AmiA/AmiB activator)